MPFFFWQRFGGTILGTPATLVREHGWYRGLTRGMIPTLGRESLYTMAMLGMAPIVQLELHTTCEDHTHQLHT